MSFIKLNSSVFSGLFRSPSFFIVELAKLMLIDGMFMVPDLLKSSLELSYCV